MEIKPEKVVSIDYTLKDDSGKVLDTSNESEPLSFIFGKGSIIPGLEKALEGKTPGEEISVTVEPEEGYGEYDESLIIQVTKDKFQDPDNVQEGMQVQAQSQDGHVQILTVKSVEGEQVTLDANHPLAGQRLSFDVAVADVREPSQEELDHGHVHDGSEEHE
ncbi:MAG: peptidylprolyl isomerase [Spirochaetaceae bacterium]